MKDMYPWERALVMEHRREVIRNRAFKALALVMFGLAAGLLLGSVIVWTY